MEKGGWRFGTASWSQESKTSIGKDAMLIDEMKTVREGPTNAMEKKMEALVVENQRLTHMLVKIYQAWLKGEAPPPPRHFSADLTAISSVPAVDFTSGEIVTGGNWFTLQHHLACISQILGSSSPLAKESPPPVEATPFAKFTATPHYVPPTLEAPPQVQQPTPFSKFTANPFAKFRATPLVPQASPPTESLVVHNESAKTETPPPKQATESLVVQNESEILPPKQATELTETPQVPLSPEAPQIVQPEISMDEAPYKGSLFKLKKGPNQSFRDYAALWIEQALKVKPPINKDELVDIFISLQDDDYYHYLLPMMGRTLTPVTKMGMFVEEGLKSGRLMSMTAMKASMNSVTQIIADKSKAPPVPGRKRKRSTNETGPQSIHPKYRSQLHPQHQPRVSEDCIPSRHFSSPVDCPAHPNIPSSFKFYPGASNLAPTGESYASLFQRLEVVGLLKAVEGKNIKNIGQYFKCYDPALRCAYHSDMVGHDIERCGAFKNVIQRLFDAGSIPPLLGAPNSEPNSSSVLVKEDMPMVSHSENGRESLGAPNSVSNELQASVKEQMPMMSQNDKGSESPNSEPNELPILVKVSHSDKGCESLGAPNSESNQLQVLVKEQMPMVSQNGKGSESSGVPNSDRNELPILVKEQMPMVSHNDKGCESSLKTALPTGMKEGSCKPEAKNVPKPLVPKSADCGVQSSLTESENETTKNLRDV